MIQLSLPIFEEKGRTTKDQVVQTLLTERSLSIAKIHRKIKKEFNLGITYQAVRKSIEALVKQGVLKQNGTEYSLEEKWLMAIKSFADKALNKKSNQITKDFQAKYVRENFTSFTLTSLFELDNFWGDLLLHLAKECPKDKRFSINIGHHAWWILVNLGRESYLYSEYKRIGMKTYFILLKNNSLNKRAASVYEELGIPTVVLDGTFVDECVGIDSVGEVIVEVKYPQEIIAEINNYVKQHPEGDYEIPEITRIVHKPCKIILNIYKNKNLVDAFNEKHIETLRKHNKYK